MKKELWVRLWSGCSVVLDAHIDQDGNGSFVTRPQFPNNETRMPDVQFDPWAGLVRYGKADVTIVDRNPEPDRG